MQSGWLTPDTARDDALRVISELNIAQENSVTSVQQLNNPMVDGRVTSAGNAITEVQRARNALANRPFCRSVGIVDKATRDEHETWYISDSNDTGGNTADLNILPWTHWIGKVANQVRDQLERGERPETLHYGPQGDTTELPVGPLVDGYVIEAERLLSFHFVEATPTPAETEVGSDVSEERAHVVNDDTIISETGRPSDSVTKPISLKPIISTLDLVQEDEIRGPMSGVFILTGGPGTGKTSVALHRIPYLINEQNRANEWKITVPHSHEERFFTAESTLIVVQQFPAGRNRRENGVFWGPSS